MTDDNVMLCALVTKSYHFIFYNFLLFISKCNEWLIAGLYTVEFSVVSEAFFCEGFYRSTYIAYKIFYCTVCLSQIGQDPVTRWTLCIKRHLVLLSHECVTYLFQGNVCFYLDLLRSSSTTCMTPPCLSSTKWASPTWWPGRHQGAKTSQGTTKDCGQCSHSWTLT